MNEASGSVSNDIGSIIRRYGVFIFLFVFFVGNCIFTKNFLAVSTVWLLFIQAFPVLVCGCGMLFVIASGGIDISIGAALAFAGIVCTKLYITCRWPLIIAVLVCLAAAAVIGVINGFIIARYNVQPVVVTLVMMLVGRGFAQVVTSGHPIAFSYTLLNKISGFRFWTQGMPIQIPLALILVLLVFFIFKKTVFGKQVQAIGDNREAARLAGVNTFFVTTMVYIMASISGALAAVIEVGRLSNAEAGQLGMNIEMSAIAAVAIGGTSMSGGKANVWGMVAGALIMQLTTMTINMNNILSSWGKVAQAVILIIAVFIQNYKSRR